MKRRNFIKNTSSAALAAPFLSYHSNTMTTDDSNPCNDIKGLSIAAPASQQPVKWWKPIPFTIPDDYYPDGIRLSDSPTSMEKKYRDGIRTFIYIYEQFRENGKLENLSHAHLIVKSNNTEFNGYASEDLMDMLMHKGCIFNTWAHAFGKPQTTEKFQINLYPEHRPSWNIELECILSSEIIRHYAFSIDNEYRPLVDINFEFYSVNPHKPKFYSPIYLPENPIQYSAYQYYKKYHAIPPSNIGEEWCKVSSKMNIDDFLIKFDNEYMEKLKQCLIADPSSLDSQSPLSELGVKEKLLKHIYLPLNIISIISLS